MSDDAVSAMSLLGFLMVPMSDGEPPEPPVPPLPPPPLVEPPPPPPQPTRLRHTNVSATQIERFMRAVLSKRVADRGAPTLRARRSSSVKNPLTRRPSPAK